MRLEVKFKDREKRWMIVCSTKYFKVEGGGGIGPVLPVRMVFSYDGSLSSEVLLTGCAIISTHKRFCFHHRRIRSHTLFLLCRDK